MDTCSKTYYLLWRSWFKKWFPHVNNKVFGHIDIIKIHINWRKHNENVAANNSKFLLFYLCLKEVFPVRLFKYVRWKYDKNKKNIMNCICHFGRSPADVIIWPFNNVQIYNTMNALLKQCFENLRKIRQFSMLYLHNHKTN